MVKMQQVINGDWLANTVFVHFFLRHSDKQMILSDWKQPPSFDENCVKNNKVGKHYKTTRRREKKKQIEIIRL